MMMNRRLNHFNNILFLWFLLPLLSLSMVSCSKNYKEINPNVSYKPNEEFIQKLPAAFPPLSQEEKKYDWGKEYLIAQTFAKRFELYQSIQNFKRAEILIPEHEESRRLEIEYQILLCYYLGRKYDRVVEAFEKGSLLSVNKSFTAFHDLLLILHESYFKVGDEKKAKRIQKVINESFPSSSKEIKISKALLDGDIQTIEKYANDSTYNYLNEFLHCYNVKKKSVTTAKTLNALLPGSGYLYLGQKKSAFTAFFLNALFIWGTYEFFSHNHIPAGIITLSFEMGWYFGGIHGAGEEAKYYNEYVYNTEVKKVLNEKELFPFFMLRYSF